MSRTPLLLEGDSSTSKEERTRQTGGFGTSDRRTHGTPLKNPFLPSSFRAPESRGTSVPSSFPSPPRLCGGRWHEGILLEGSRGHLGT